MGPYPVGENDMCDDYRTLTPTENQTFGALETAMGAMRIAEAAHDTSGFLRARARSDVLADRLGEAWSPQARAAAQDRADSRQIRRFFEPRGLFAPGPPALLGEHHGALKDDAAAPYPPLEAPHQLREGFRSDDLFRVDVQSRGAQ